MRALPLITALILAFSACGADTKSGSSGDCVLDESTINNCTL